MDVLIGTVLLILVLSFFTPFNYKAPHGTKAMGALASAACVSFFSRSLSHLILWWCIRMGLSTSCRRL